MTVSSEVSTAGPFFGNGSVKTFPYAFKILDEKHIRVVFISALGDVSDLSLANGDYTVTGVGNEAGGNVVKATPLLTGQTLTIVRRLPLTQDTSLENQGAYYPEVVEQRFDLLTMQIQSVQETTERSLTVEPGQEKPSMTLIAAAQGYSQAAKQSRDEAAGLASAAAGSASNASGSAVLASRWASEAENVPVAGGLFSAFHWYRKAYAIYQTITQGFLEKVGGILTGDVLFGPALAADIPSCKRTATFNLIVATTPGTTPGMLGTPISVGMGQDMRSGQQDQSRYRLTCRLMM